MNNDELAAQAVGLRETAEAMIKAGDGQDAVEAVTRDVVTALISAAKQLKPENSVVGALQVPAFLDWSGVLTIANVVYKA
jgi:hypothetical protein